MIVAPSVSYQVEIKADFIFIISYFIFIEVLCTVFYFDYYYIPEEPSLQPYLDDVLQQLLTVLIECVSQPFEVISRLGCSCIR